MISRTTPVVPVQSCNRAGHYLCYRTGVLTSTLSFFSNSQTKSQHHSSPYDFYQGYLAVMVDSIDIHIFVFQQLTNNIAVPL